MTGNPVPAFGTGPLHPMKYVSNSTTLTRVGLLYYYIVFALNLTFIELALNLLNLH